MLTLGLNAFHPDASAALVERGRVVACVAEERLNRVKHSAGFPERAIREVLRTAGAQPSDVGAVCVARDSRANLLTRAGYVLSNIGSVAKAAAKRLRERASQPDVFALAHAALGFAPGACKAAPVRVEHHLAHAASSFFASGFERAAILTLDGFGDFASVLIARGEGSRIEPLARVFYPHSLGILYTAVCQFIGFDRYGDEGKVMGLAPYGEPRFEQAFERLLKLTPRGFELGLEYFRHHTQGVEQGVTEAGTPHFERLFSDRMLELFGEPAPRGEAPGPRERDIAASLQASLEQAVLHLARMACEKAGSRDLCLAGGVALNSVANARILEAGIAQRIHIHPAAGDDGTAVGAALWHEVTRLGAPRSELTRADLGSRFSQGEVEQAVREALDGAGEVEASQPGEAAIVDACARAMAEGGIVGWFQGGMEWGPRALGHRSILAHPGLAGMKDTLNARIKRREPFRPFAPSILHERLSDYFESTHPSPFMLMVYRTRPARRAELAAVDHVDHTGRVQTVRREDQPLYHALISRFGEITGTPVVLNTSFNENEPIVRTPREALDCFLRTRMDMLALGPVLLRRKDTTGAAQLALAVREERR